MKTQRLQAKNGNAIQDEPDAASKTLDLKLSGASPVNQKGLPSTSTNNTASPVNQKGLPLTSTASASDTSPVNQKELPSKNTASNSVQEMTAGFQMDTVLIVGFYLQ